jgi:tetratricopeptide (TPR) repeat protein
MLAEDGDATAIPPTINALLTARLDRLEEGDRAVLGRASVVGEVFYLDAVRALAPEDERDATAARVRGLLRRELVRPEASDLPGVEAYRFHHALLRDAAYAMVPKETRADLHEALAGWLDEHDEIETDEFVGYHLGRAVTYRRELGLSDERTNELAEAAGARLSSAGRRAADRGDSGTAKVLFERASGLRPPRTAQAGWDLLRYVWAILDEERLGDATEALALAVEAARAAGDRRLTAQVELTDSYVRCLREPEGSVAAQRVLLDRWEPELQHAGDPRDLAVFWLVALQGPWMAYRWPEVRADAQRSLAAALEAGDDAFARRASGFQGAAGFYGSTPLETLLGESDMRERLAGGSPLATAFVVNARGAMLGMVGRDDDADRAFARAEALLREVIVEVPGNALAQPRALLAELRDRTADAVALLEPALLEMREQGDLAHRSTLAGAIANLRITLGRYDEARPLSADCRELTEVSDLVNQILWRRADARIAAVDGDEVLARRLMGEAIDLIDATDALIDRAETWMNRAEIDQRLGERETARVALGRSRELYEAKGVVIGVRRIDRRLAAFDA